MENYYILENGLLKVELKAQDFDNDLISFSAEGLPENARIEGNIFSFKPDYNFVKGKEKEEIKIKFIADDGKSKAEQSAIITVFNKNQPPKIINFSKDVIAKVNEPITLFVVAKDADADSLSYLWDFGLLDKYSATAVHKRTFTSKGEKVVKVTVSDGIDEAVHVFNIIVV